MPIQTQPDAVKLPSYYQQPKILPTAEWSPDTPDFLNAGCTRATNVYPQSLTSYGPVPSLAPLGSYVALPAPVIGMFSYLDASAQTHLFAGQPTKIFRLHTGDTAFIDITKVAATYGASVSSPWSMTAFGNSIIATDGADAPQVFTIGTSNFVDLSAGAPIAKYACTVRDFLFLGFCTESSTIFPQRIHWSAIGNPSNWPTAGTNPAIQVQSDYQDLRADLGHVRGLASGLQNADVAIFMDRGVYSGLYTKGGTQGTIFSFQVVQGAEGCRAPQSIVSHHGSAFYQGNNGFYQFDGTTITPIGAQKIDRWFFTDSLDGVDQAKVLLTQGSADPLGKFIYWLYYGPQNNGTPNRVLVYNWSLQRWSVIRLSAQWLAKGLTLGYTLDQLDSFGTIETLPASLDDPLWQGGALLMLAFDANNNLAYFGGPSMAASLETAEAQPTPGMRSRVTGAKPLIDGGDSTGVTVSMGTRNRLEDPILYSPASTMNVWGNCVQRVDARYVRAQINIPAGAVWSHCLGAELDFGKSTVR